MQPSIKCPRKERAASAPRAAGPLKGFAPRQMLFVFPPQYEQDVARFLFVFSRGREIVLTGNVIYFLYSQRLTRWSSWGAGTNSSRYEALQSDVNCGGCSVSVCTFMLLSDANGRKSCMIYDNWRFISLLPAEQSAERASTMRALKAAALLLTAAGENFPHRRSSAS